MNSQLENETQSYTTLHIGNVKFQTDVGINGITSAQSRNLSAKSQPSFRKETSNNNEHDIDT